LRNPLLEKRRERAFSRLSQIFKTTAGPAATLSRFESGELHVLSTRLIHTAVAFFVLGVSLGIYMGLNQDFRFTHVHAHLNLLGWVALALAGLLYAAYPELEHGWLAHAHYWLHTVGLAVFMGGFAWSRATGDFHFVSVAGGASMVALGVLLFAINVFSRLRAPTAIQGVR
jgi:cbb3-type cytochrome oxidase subunit 1